MNNEVFNPDDWLSPGPSQNTHPLPSMMTRQRPSIDVLVQNVEASGIDITETYSNWLAIAFALADELGADGEDYFLRLSRFNPEYDEAKARHQYAECLRHAGHGITIATLFYIAKQYGIDGRSDGTSAIFAPSPKNSISKTSKISKISNTADVADEADELRQGEGQPLPTFSQAIRSRLPKILQRVVEDSISDTDADLLILGSVTVFSACIPNVSGIYGRREVFSNLFLFVSAKASAGKGRLSLCRHLIDPIHRQLRERSASLRQQYEKDLVNYALNKKNGADAPKEPPFLTLFIPANSSATVVYQTLAENDGVGIIFETEGDTLANSFESDFGNYSDGFRKAFHHEPITYLRKKDHEYVELTKPKFSALLSGTPQQIAKLIPCTENGLFSRFIFYSMDVGLQWNDVFDTKGTTTDDEQFALIGADFYNFYQTLAANKIRFSLTAEQQQKFNDFFAATQLEYAVLFGDDIIASVRRLGLIQFRIAMIFSVLRLIDEDKPLPINIVCNDDDFSASAEIVRVLLQHTATIYQTIPGTSRREKNFSLSADSTDHTYAAKFHQDFLDHLPEEFDYQAYQHVAQSLNIPARTASTYISELCKSGSIIRLKKGHYQKQMRSS